MGLCQEMAVLQSMEAAGGGKSVRGEGAYHACTLHKSFLTTMPFL